MGKTLSPDLRRRIIRFVENGGSRREAARRFEVSPSFAVKLLARWRKIGDATAARRGRRRPGPLAAHHAFLIGAVEARPDITMPELAAALFKARRIAAAPATLSRLLCRLGFSFKKNAAGVGMRTRGRRGAPA